MKVLITGATGLIGKELVSALLDNGAQIHYLTTSEKRIKNEPNCKGFLWNSDSGYVDPDCIDGVEAIIHLAGAPIAKRWTDAYKKEIIDSRIKTADILYTLLKNHPNNVHHFISSSAIGIYPDSLTKVYSEDETQFDDSFLSRIVQQWEASADKFKDLGLRVAKVRTGLVLSGKGGMLKEVSGPVKFGVGSAFGSGKQMQSWIHIDDQVGIYAYILSNELEGAYNAVAPFPVTNEELIKQVAKAMDKPYFMPNVPRFAMKLLLGEMHTILFDSQNVSAKKIIAAGYQFKFLSLEKALKEELN